MGLKKSGKMGKHDFNLHNKKLSSTGSFKRAEQTMSDKASKTLFKLKALLSSAYLKPDIAMKLFDQLIKPIALYGSEIWGPDPRVLTS